MFSVTRNSIGIFREQVQTLALNFQLCMVDNTSSDRKTNQVNKKNDSI